MSVMRPLTISLQAKLTWLIVGIIAPLTILMAFVSCTRQIEMLSIRLYGKASSFAHILAHGAQSAIAFDDRQTARELFDSVAFDAEFAAAALYDADGKLLEARGTSTCSPGAPDERPAPIGDRVCVTMGVQSVEGPTGTLVIELSQVLLRAEEAHVVERIAFRGLLVIVCGAFAAFAAGRALGRRIRIVEQRATSVAAGALDQPDLVVSGNDEIARMSDAFNRMVRTIRQQVTQLRENARSEAERLEAMVAVRTRELDRRDGAMRLLLDSVHQGFLTVSRDGIVSSERSAMVDRWLPALGAHRSLWHAIAPLDPRAARWLEVGWDMVRDDVLPIEVSLDQLPKRMQVGSQVLALQFSVAGEEILCVITDVTNERARAQLESAERERLELFGHVLRNRSIVEGFAREGDELVARITADGTDAHSVLALHTLKGNCATLGLHSLATRCHEIEQKMTDRDPSCRDACAALAESWKELRRWLGPLLGAGRRRVEISSTEHQAFLAALRGSRPRAELHAWANSWALEPIEPRLELLAESARQAARRLGRGTVKVAVASGGIKTEPGRMDAVWSTAVHAVRNAVDHGAESEDARRGAGKQGPPQISIDTRLVGLDLLVEVRDDGPGVDWSRVAEKARRLGRPAEARAELVEALFEQALTTRDHVTELCGRGVGLSALRVAVLEVGGRIEVESDATRGTTIRCVIPADRVGAVAV